MQWSCPLDLAPQPPVTNGTTQWQIGDVTQPVSSQQNVVTLLRVGKMQIAEQNAITKATHQASRGHTKELARALSITCSEWSEQSLGSWTNRRPCKVPLAISYRGSTGMVRPELTGGIARPGRCQRSTPMTDSSNRSAQLPTKCCCSMSGRTSQSTIDKATNPTNHHRHRTRSMAMTP